MIADLLDPPMQPLRHAPITLRLPALDDALTIDRYARHPDGLEGDWLPTSHVTSSEYGSWLVEDWLAGWAGQSSWNGRALVITHAGSRDLVGVVGIGERGSRIWELTYGVAPPWRRRGIATQGAHLAADWLTVYRGATVVELRIGSGHVDSQRVAARARFHLAGTVEDTVHGTGEKYQDLRLVYVPEPRGR